MEAPEVPLEEVHEHIHHATHAHANERWIGLVALSTAVLAAIAALASLLAGHEANEAMLHHISRSDDWGHYQAKSIKLNVIETRDQLMVALGKPVPPDDVKQIDRYKGELDGLGKEAKELEVESGKALQCHEIAAGSVTLFQIAIALGAVAVLTKRRRFWHLSLVLGAGGVCVLAWTATILFAHGSGAAPTGEAPATHSAG